MYSAGVTRPDAHDEISIEHLTRVDSTMLEARRRIAGGADRAFMLRADEQSGGYGRHGRAWHSPVGGLWATLACPMPRVAGEGALGLRAGIAACRMVDDVVTGRVAGADSRAGVRLKWPNDVIIDDRKVCGVLCERVSEGGAAWLLVGVGINVTNEPTSLPEGLRRPATSLARATGRTFELDALAQCLRDALAHALAHPLDLQTTRWAASRLWRLDHSIRVTTREGGDMVDCMLRGLSADGRLVVDALHGRDTLPEGVEIVG